MTHYKLPSLRTIVENIELKTAKLDKILAESQSHVATYLDIHYDDCQEIIFLLGGKAVKAGRFDQDGTRTILNVKDALARLKRTKSGTISFFELSKLLMIVILGTFIFEPTHAKLKSKQIDFNGLMDLLARKHFIGYLELTTNEGLNYLTFFDGKAREGYFCKGVRYDAQMKPVEIIAKMIEKSDEKGEINVYESVGEEDLHKNSRHEPPAAESGVTTKPVSGDRSEQTDDSGQYTSEMVDLCVIAMYEEFFRIMVNISARQLDPPDIDTMFMECLKEATLKNAAMFRGAGTKDDGSLLPTGLINFERLLKSKERLPSATREQDFLNGLIDLAGLRLDRMQQRLDEPLLQEALTELQSRVDACKKNYQGSFIIIKFLHAFTRLIEKTKSKGHE